MENVGRTGRSPAAIPMTTSCICRPTSPGSRRRPKARRWTAGTRRRSTTCSSPACGGTGARPRPAPPVIVHGETTVESRYLAFATNPFARGDFERAWALIGQAALWSTLTDEGRPTGTLTGTVSDVSGAPIAGAAVTVTGAANRSRTTDAAGRFETNTPAGEYTVTVSAFGYVPPHGHRRGGQGRHHHRPGHRARCGPVARGVRHRHGSRGQPARRRASVTILDTPLEPAVTDAAGAPTGSPRSRRVSTSSGWTATGASRRRRGP